jgi:Predicted nucleotidyltransferase
MIITGIITEYNPFHKGHQYHIEQSRAVTKADYIVAIMSPDYVQRGVPAMLDKHTRAKMALLSGADIVIELPLEYACSSAEFFANGSITLLNQLRKVNCCCFGSEFGAIDAFTQVADMLANEPAAFKNALKAELKRGVSFPVARKTVLLEQLPNCADILDSPNNILGIEYCKALRKLNSPIVPFTIKRSADNYHNDDIDGELSSASAIRATLLNSDKDNLNTDFELTRRFAQVAPTIPADALTMLRDNWLSNGPLCEDDFSSLLRYKLLSETATTLTNYLDVSRDLANRIINALNYFESFSQFAALLKSKELTRTRINRALLHILLNIKKIPAINYARILGFRKDAAPLLGELKKSASIPLITKLAGSTYNDFAANLYESALSEKYQRPFVHEYRKPVVIV